jgi:hypothetical protein
MWDGKFESTELEGVVPQKQILWFYSEEQDLQILHFRKLGMSQHYDHGHEGLSERF